ncbi:penicillin-binding protein [Telluribacter sp.]|jgi:cell division protein FtsI (penicillin-binding protein 3)|uniref:penicillin-binding protein n=1 Tax=Telluribacter sp. TaxID=1978767 RepID=UPI002E0F4F2E|nr:penicillin-binding protein [Telluribacter sp.]
MRSSREGGQNNKQALIYRARTVSGFLLLLAVVVFVKLIRVQFYETFKGKKWSAYAEQNDLKLDTIPAMRGNIYSSDGSLLATSLPYYYVGLDVKASSEAYFDKNIDALVNKLVRHFGEYSAERYKQRIVAIRRSKRSRYLRLKSREISYLEREKVLDWPFFRREKGGGGGKFETVYRRYEPFMPMADRTIGGLNPRTGKGWVGVEASFDKKLSGRNGVELVERVEGGVRIPVGDALNIRPEPGLDVYTTLDMNFQDMAESALRRTLRQYQADYGCVVVMEVATGEIRAMANLTRRGDQDYREVFNYALAGSTDPGSTFKLPTMMAILEETGLDPNREWVNTGDGLVHYRSVKIEDTKRGGHGNITAREVMEKSSNVGVHLLMEKYFYHKPDKYLQYLKQFHLTTPTGIHMKGEKPPLIRDRTSKQWSRTSLTFMSYGYELQMTPLQTLTLYNAVANGGYWVRPMMVRQIRNAEEVVDQLEPYVEETPLCSPQTIRKVQQMLEGVVERGTARNISASHYRIAGKTGTAQKLVNGRYMVGRYSTSFAGYFPADKPKYSCIVVIDSPRGFSKEQLYAGSVAAPVFKEVADRIYAYDISMHKPTREKPAEIAKTVKWVGKSNELSAISKALNLTPLPEGEEWVQGAVASAGKVTWQARPVERPDVPDLRGMALRDALYILENKGFRVSFKGAGKVVEQSLPPGSKVSGQKSILLTLQ